MPTLKISKNNYIGNLQDLGKIVTFCKLSEKRITRAVRNKIREDFKNLNISVSCSANFKSNKWEGICWIDDIEYQYEIVK